MSGNVTPFPESKYAKAYGISGQLADALGGDGGPTTKAELIVASYATSATEPNHTLGLLMQPSGYSALAPLHELESSLMCLLDTEALVSADQEQEFLRELSETLQTTVAKRDRVGAFIKHCEARAEECASEIERLQARKKVFTNAARRVRDYVRWIIEALGPGIDGKLRKLEGDKFTFSTRKAKNRLEITDEVLIPARFKMVHVTMPAELYFGRVKKLQQLGADCSDPTVTVNQPALHQYLESVSLECPACGGLPVIAGDDTPITCPSCKGTGKVRPSVPGAQLHADGVSLVLR